MALLPKGPRGFPLCRFCKRETAGPRRTFCGEACVHEHKLRTNPGYLRRAVGKRDRGVCAVCRTDTRALGRALAALDAAARRARMEALGLGAYAHRSLSGLWDADHVRPVAEGGGECGLDGMQTLCLLCHKRKSEDQRLRKARGAG